MDSCCLYEFSKVHSCYVWNNFSSYSLWWSIRFIQSGLGLISPVINKGEPLSGAYNTITQKWNGSSWATTTAMVLSLASAEPVGNVSNAMSVGGSTSAVTAVCQVWS